MASFKMTEFTLNSELEEGEVYLVRCTYCNTGYHVAEVKQGKFISDSTDEDITEYVLGYTIIN